MSPRTSFAQNKGVIGLTAEKVPTVGDLIMLQHYEGSGATLTDSSGEGIAHTAIANYTQETTDPKFGSKNGVGDGVGDRWQTAIDGDTFDVRAVSWTWDSWVKMLSAPADFQGVFRIGVNANFQAMVLYHQSDGALDFYASTTGGSWNVIQTGAAGLLPNDGAYHHIAFQHDEPNDRYGLFVDGVLEIDFTNGTDFNLGGVNSQFVVNSASGYNNQELHARFDETRMVRDNDEFSWSGFTPHTAPYANG